MTQDLFRHLRIHTMKEPMVSKQMKSLDARQQLLVIAMEECGELIQACSKALRRGELYEHSDSETELKKEVGDVYAMLELLVEWDVLSWTEIENRRDIKRMKLSRWSDLIGESESRLYAEENSDAWRKAMGDIPEVTGNDRRVVFIVNYRNLCRCDFIN